MNTISYPQYPFPVIEHLDDVWPYVKDDQDTFYLKDFGSYQVLGYRSIFSSTFRNPSTAEKQIARECRGLVFDQTGRIISRPFHKFMNLGEDQHSLDLLDKITYLQDKLDGSLVRPVLVNNDLLWMTKGGRSDTAVLCEQMLEQHTAYQQTWKDEILNILHNNLTPLFEFIGPLNHHVVAYEKNTIRLLAIRNNNYGTYNSPESMGYWCSVPQAALCDMPSELSVEELQRLAGTFPEGLVAVTAKGHRVKVKNTNYLALHRAKDQMNNELYVFNLVKEGKVDDVLGSGVLQEVDQDRLIKYQAVFLSNFHARLKELHWALEPHWNKERKDFAFVVQTLPKRVQGFCWSAYHAMREQGSPCLEELALAYQVENKRQLEIWKWFINDLSWSDF